MRFNDVFELIKAYPILDERWHVQSSDHPAFFAQVDDFPKFIWKGHKINFDLDYDSWGREFPDKVWRYEDKILHYGLQKFGPYYENWSTVCSEKVRFELYY